MNAHYAHGFPVVREQPMTALPSTEQAGGGIRTLFLRWPWWLSVCALYLLARLASTLMLLILASVQGPNPWTGARPSYLSFASLWDGTWYKIIAYWGYPSHLPLTSSGHVAENAWAFLPGYPALVRSIMVITGQPWERVSVIVSLLFGLAASLVFYLTVRRMLEKGSALFAVLLFCINPVSPLFQVAYAESMYLFLLFLGLYLLLERRYGWLFLVVVLMSFTRPGSLAFALCLGLHVLYRWFTRGSDPYSRSERFLGVSLVAFTTVMGFSWPMIAWLVTGSFSAYTDTELAWRSSYIGYQHLVPFAGVFQGANWWLTAPVGAAVLCLLLLIFSLFMATRGARRLPIDLRFWVVSYLIYLLAVFFPQSSTFRLLLPMVPLVAVFALPRSALYRLSLSVIFLAAQWGWLLLCWGVNGQDWTPP